MKPIEILDPDGELSFEECMRKINSLERVGLNVVVTADDKFARTGIVMEGTGGSFDIVTQDGHHLFRLNVAISSDNVSIDVIPATKIKDLPSENPQQDPYIHILAWNQGVKVVDCLAPMVCAKLLTKHTWDKDAQA